MTSYYWSSTENNNNNAWNQNFNNGNTNNNNKNNNNAVRAVRICFNQLIRPLVIQIAIGFFIYTIKMIQLSLFDNPKNERVPIALWELFDAYYSCRSNKRNTINALAFELDYESNLIALYNIINSGDYYPSKSITFIVNKPVTREIFAADFRDRVVHHWLIAKLNPLFEQQFINDSYACRIGKGTHFGVKRLDGFIKSCSKNYTTDCYILKLDIQGFFMHINRTILYEKLHDFVKLYYKENDKSLVLDLCQKIIFNDPKKNCIIKGNKSNWNDLPHNKSLFHSPKDCGLPIGNLTSQVFANFYMNAFDHFIKK